jgi:hypothetical protein
VIAKYGELRQILNTVETAFNDAARQLAAIPNSLTATVESWATSLALIPTGAQAASEATTKQAAATAEVGAAQVKTSADVDALNKKLEEQSALFGKTATEADIHKLALAGATDGQLAYARTVAEFLKVQKAVHGAGDLIAQLREEIDTFGMAAAQADVYKLAVAGAAPEQVRLAQALGAQLQELEDNKKLMEELDAEAKGVFEDTRTPAEKLGREMQLLKNLLSEGKIDLETFGRAKQKLDKQLAEDTGAAQLKESLMTPLESFRKEMDRLNKLSVDGLIDSETFNRAGAKAFNDLQQQTPSAEQGQAQRPGALDLGSKEAYSAILNFRGMGDNDPIKDVARTAKAQLQQVERQTSLMERMVGALQLGKAEPVKGI